MRVLLIQMPFFTLDTASISLSMVKAALTRAGFDCDIEYFNLAFGDRLGIDLYSWIAGDSPPYLLFGDLIFAPSLHNSTITVERLKNLIAPLGTPGVPHVPPEVVEAYPELVEAARELLHDKLAEIEWSKYGLVGFSTMFQIAPPLAMARLVKSLPDAPPVILGGSYCEGEMGEHLLHKFPWIDYVARGEAEELIVEIARHLADCSVPLEQISGLIWRDGEEILCNGETAELHPGKELVGLLARGKTPEGSAPQPYYELDRLPIPKYDDWLDQVRAHELFDDLTLRLPIETSRGCWYGEKHHCTFCGLNGATIAYRRKSPGRALLEFQELMSYGIKLIHSVDDILDFRYLKTLLPELVKLNHGCEIFYEIKANLTYEQVQLLHDSGIVWIQPGIESLSTPVLALMDKGVTALQNVRLLRYTAEFCIGTAWNLLYGFPGENPDDFRAISEILPMLAHLQPPYISCCQVRIHRFSPLYEKREAVGLKDVNPTASYYEIYPFERDVVAKMAYYFEHGYRCGEDPNSYISSCADAVKRWHGEVGRAAFLSFDRDETTHLIDTRAIASVPRSRLVGLEREVWRACTHGCSLHGAAERLHCSEGEILPVLESFVERHWVLYLDDKYLSLAVPMDKHVLPHVPLPLIENGLHKTYCAQMARIHQGFVEAIPSLDRLHSKGPQPSRT